MADSTFVEPRTWYAQLPTLYAATGALLTDPDGRVLVVKPNYRDHWTLPGGMLEDGESPAAGCARELAEELGLELPVGALLVVAWAPAFGDRPRPVLNLIFDAGVLADPAPVKLQRTELDDFALLSPEQAAARLPLHSAPRIAAALAARSAGATAYLA